MRTFFSVTSSAALVFGLLSLLPPSYEGAATLPVWASIALVGGGLLGSAISAARNFRPD